MKDLVLLLEFQKGIQRWPESQKEKKINEENLNSPEELHITFWIPKGNSKLAQVKKKMKEERNRRKYVSTAQTKKKRKERKKSKKVGFYNINLYFRWFVPLRKRCNDFSKLQQLHKSQTPLPLLSSEKMIDN